MLSYFYLLHHLNCKQIVNNFKKIYTNIFNNDIIIVYYCTREGAAKQVYGYLKCFLPNMNRTEKAIFRKYYCSTCLAIKKNYGYFSTVILSYDLTVLPIALGIFDETVKSHKRCHYQFGVKDPELDSELWKPIAALNLAIAEENRTDALSDKGSFSKKLLYRIVGLFIKRGVKRAKQDFPELFEAASRGMQRVIEAEKTECDITAQGEAFADMILSSLDTFTELTPERRELIRGISIWLCLMDAIDDLDKDIREGAYNPLLYTEGLKAETKKSLINTKYIELSKYINSLRPLFAASMNKSEHAIVNRAIELYNYKIIPYQTAAVLNKR